MISLKFTGIIPNDSVPGAIDFLDTLDWNLTIHEKDEQWSLFSGD